MSDTEDRYRHTTDRERVLARVKECLAAARARWPGADITTPRVRFDLRGRAAGQADRSGTFIRINANLLDRYPDRIVERTTAHEIAHVVAQRCSGRTSARTAGNGRPSCASSGASPVDATTCKPRPRAGSASIPFGADPRPMRSQRCASEGSAPAPATAVRAAANPSESESPDRPGPRSLTTLRHRARSAGPRRRPVLHSATDKELAPCRQPLIPAPTT